MITLKEDTGFTSNPTAFNRRRELEVYLIILTCIFTAFFIFELIFDFIVPTWLAIMAPLCFLLPLIFLYLRFRSDLVFTLNLILIVFLLEGIFLNNPRSYHVLVYWIGIIPILIVSLTTGKSARFWSIVFLLYIIGNGLYAYKYIGPYSLELFPIRYLAGGVIFWMVAYITLRFFHVYQSRYKKQLENQNDELTKLKAEIESQNDLLKDQHDEINAVNEELKTSNDYLELRIRERTRDLEFKNEQLKEYAFINSHILRAPVARIIGLINLLSLENPNPQNQEMLEHLHLSGQELDEVVGKINKALDEDTALSRDSISMGKPSATDSL